MSDSPTASRIPTRRGALLSATGALAVIGGSFMFPLYMTGILGGPPHGETAWEMVVSLANSYGMSNEPQTFDSGSYIGTLVLPIGLLMLPLALACLVLLLSIAAFFAPLPRLLVLM